MSTRTKILAAVAVLAVVVIVLTRGGEQPSAQLQALEGDPMASYVPPGGTLVDTVTQKEGTSLGKPVPAQYARMFELNAAAAAAALDHAREAAVAAGWTRTKTSGERGFVAEADGVGPARARRRSVPRRAPAARRREAAGAPDHPAPPRLTGRASSQVRAH